MEIKVDFTVMQYEMYQSVMQSAIDAPPPWLEVVHDNVSASIIAVGINDSEEYILCLTSTDDIIIYNTFSGKVFTFPDIIDAKSPFNLKNLRVDGVGPLENEVIKTMGVYGSSADVRFYTDDGWKLNNFCFPYYQNNILLTNPNENLSKHEFRKIYKTSTTLIAYSFSLSGNLFFVVERDSVLIYRKNNFPSDLEINGTPGN